MNKISKKVWTYATVFLTEGIMFNVALIFSIVALVFNKDGMTIWAIIAIASASTWLSLLIIKHLIWLKMEKIERALYLAIRKHGKKIINILSSEVTAKGQSDIHEILTDVDNGIEIQMLVNGGGTFINTFIGIKWFIQANHFHKSNSTFEYVTDEAEQ